MTVLRAAEREPLSYAKTCSDFETVMANARHIRNTEADRMPMSDDSLALCCSCCHHRMSALMDAHGTGVTYSPFLVNVQASCESLCMTLCTTKIKRQIVTLYYTAFKIGIS